MTSADNQLFSVEDALSRLSQTKDQGCLLAYRGAELVHIYVQDGFIIRAFGSIKDGEKAVEQALHMSEASYQWLRGIQPPDPNKNIYLNIREFTNKHGNINKSKMTETSRGLNGVVKKEAESKFRYFLVPQDKPTEKLYLTKTSTVMGRDNAADLVIDNFDVSRRHCLLDIQARGVFILDLDSSNGTFVNGILVRDGYVNPGDRIELGPCIYTVNREPIDPED